MMATQNDGPSFTPMNMISAICLEEDGCYLENVTITVLTKTQDAQL